MKSLVHASVHPMIERESVFALIAGLVGAVGCAGAGQSVTVAEASSGAEVSSSESPSGDDDLFVSLPVGVSLRKPSSWHFVPTAWRNENLKNIDLELAELVREYATEPLAIVTKYEETTDSIDPTFQLIFRPLGQLVNMSPEDVASLAVRTMSQTVEDAEVVDDIESLEISGYPAAHYAVKYTLRTSTGDAFPTLADAWIVKRGAYVFMLGGSGPPDGDDASRLEFEAMVRSIVIEP